jgi:hypothetical protein
MDYYRQADKADRKPYAQDAQHAAKSTCDEPALKVQAAIRRCYRYRGNDHSHDHTTDRAGQPEAATETEDVSGPGPLARWPRSHLPAVILAAAG